MQLMKNRKQIGLTLALLFTTSIVTPSIHATTWTKKQIAGTAVFATALATFVRLVTKKTQPKRVYPKDDSTAELAWYIFDELLVGQIEKGERPNKVVINRNDSSELFIEYGKVEARGVAGILYSSMKPVIIPALTLMLLFNNDFLKKVSDAITATRTFIDDPSKPLNEISLAFTAPLPELNASK